mgnify:CR=1 FL=1
MLYTDLGGHSGCQVILCEPEVGAPFVKKISNSIEYNHRLIAQKNKQESYENSFIKAPKILDDGYTDAGLYYFSMQYIQGITLAEYIKTIEITKIQDIVKELMRDIEKVTSSTVDNSGIFLQKIDSLKKQLFILHNPIINEAIDLLSAHDWSIYSKSQCHGDLTLENIIVKNNELYFIDFLDSFFDSWILDIGTILQDVHVMWSYRNEDNVSINTLLRLMVFRDLLVDEAKRKLGNQYIEIYFSLLLKLVRIYPYTKDTKTYEFLNQKTKRIIYIIKKEVADIENVNNTVCRKKNL